MADDESRPAPPRVVVTLPAPLVNLFPGSVRRLELAAASVGEVIDALEARWPGMRDRLCDSRPAIRRHLNVFVGSERASLATRLPPGAEVTIMTAISGGSPALAEPGRRRGGRPLDRTGKGVV
ncbi:MAG: MoaD/ThiS family protein [Proteobacteria bacterium]|nr:MoaD/ThiS family protein [Pseudomonadota bacterium]